MRSLLSRSVRPSLGHSIPSGRPSTKLSVRKAGFPPIRKQFTFCDAFTILLAPVLTTAFVVEHTRKERRRQAWDKRIAEVQAETEALRSREVEAWTTLQRRSIRHGLHAHCRSFSTAAPVPHEVEDGFSSSYEIEHDNSGQFIDEDIGEGTRSAPEQLSDADRAVHRRWTRLISIRLALQMLIHLRVGDSEGYKQQSMVRLDPELFPQGMDGLLEKMRLVKGLMRGVAKQGIPLEVHEQTDGSRDLHVQITKLSNLLRFKQINLPTFISSYSNIVANSTEGFSTASLRLLMLALSGREHLQMASFVAGAMWESAQLLSEGDIRDMLAFYAQQMDAMRIQRLLKRLARGDSFPRPRQPWMMTEVDGMQLAVPKFARHLVLERLIQATLRCKQVDSASAYTKIFHQYPRQAYSRMFVVNSFLIHYTDTRDWTRGVEWLQQAKIRATSAAAYGLSEERLSFTILCMLNFCKVCGQDEEYNNIIDAAVSARLNVPTNIDKTRSQTRSICNDWMNRLHLWNPSRMPDADSLVVKASHFQEILAKTDSHLTPFVGIEDPHRIAKLQTSIDCSSSKAEQSGGQVTAPTVMTASPHTLLSPLNPILRDDIRNMIASHIGRPFPRGIYREIYKLSVRKAEAKTEDDSKSSAMSASSPKIGTNNESDAINWQSLLDELICWRSVYNKEDAAVLSRESVQDENLLEALHESQERLDNTLESKVKMAEKKLLPAMKPKVDKTTGRLDSRIAVADPEDEGYFSDSSLTSSSQSPGFRANQASPTSKQRSRIGPTLPPPDYVTHHYAPALVEYSPG